MSAVLAPAPRAGRAGHGPGLFDRISLNLDLARALRASISFSIAIAIVHFLATGRADGVYVALTAQAIGLNDFRGGAFFRLSLIAFCTLVMVGSTLLGIALGPTVWGTVIGVMILAALGGVWRQLSADYGPFLSVNSALLFMLASAGSSAPDLGHLAGLIIGGGALAAGVQMVVWFIRPQQQIRNVLGEVWVNVSDLAAAMRTETDAAGTSRVADCELNLRDALDRTFTVLGAEKNWRQSTLVTHLEEMRREAVHLTMRLTAFHAAFEALPGEERLRYNPTVDSAIKALGDAARSTALTLVNHRSENLAASTMRWTRAGRLWQALEEPWRARTDEPTFAHLQILRHAVERTLPVVRDRLATTVDHTDTRWTIPVGLPEMSPRSLRELTGWVEARWEWDPVLVRHSVRVMFLTGAAMALYRLYHVPHGYWIAFTIIIILQPDYGSTRLRAGQRIVGTLGGVLASSVILWLQPPATVELALLPLVSFGFAYFLKRRYAVAAFFVTLLIVLLTRTAGPVQGEFIAWRLGCTVLGGVAALAAAHFFWPSWEQPLLSALLARALRENARYLRLLLANGPDDEILWARRDAEHANVLVAASLKRMLAEPARRTATGAGQAETVTYLQRFTRALTVLLVHRETAGPTTPREDPFAAEAGRHLETALEQLAQAISPKPDDPAALTADPLDHLNLIEAELAAIDQLSGAWSGTGSSPVRSQLLKCAGEIRAMLLAQEPRSPATTPA